MIKIAFIFILNFKIFKYNYKYIYIFVSQGIEVIITSLKSTPANDIMRGLAQAQLEVPLLLV
jgi:hypothetical protein